MTTTATATRLVERATNPTTIVTPPTATIEREPGARLLKKLYATRPALAHRDPGVVRP